MDYKVNKMYTAATVLRKLKELENPQNREGMKRFGINVEKAYGIQVVDIRKMAKKIKNNHKMALGLWKSEIHEARLLAVLVDEPKKVSEKQMEKWVRDFNSWDICDMCCNNLFNKLPWAYNKAFEWSARKEEFVKRAGFVLMATLSVHDKKAQDNQFTQFFPIIIRESTDERNFVKKAVNWSLRQIGKRNLVLNQEAIKIAEKLERMDDETAKWIAKDALRELRSDAVQKRLSQKLV